MDEVRSGRVASWSGSGFAWDELEVGYRFRTVGRTVTEADLVNFISITGMRACQVRHDRMTPSTP